MDELLLYKLVTIPDPEDLDIRYVSEMGWINDESFCVWIDLCEALEGYIDLEDVFPKEHFKH